MSNETSDNGRTAEDGQRLNVSVVFSEVAALVAAKGDVKLAAELLKLREHEVLKSYIQHADEVGALGLVQNSVLLMTLQLFDETQRFLVEQLQAGELNSREAIKLLELLLNAVNFNSVPRQPVQATQVNFINAGDPKSELMRRLTQLTD